MTVYVGFNKSTNWEKVSAVDIARPSLRGSSKNKLEVNITRILYVPYFLEPGFFTPRMCMDSYACSDIDIRAMARSSKTFLRGNQFADDTILPNPINDSANSFAASIAKLPVVPTTVKRKTMGVLVEVLDELELVWAENEKWDM